MLGVKVVVLVVKKCVRFGIAYTDIYHLFDMI